jgi:hypothetical protein
MKTLKKFFSAIQFKTLGGFVVGFVILFVGSVGWVVIRNEPAPEYYGYFLVSIMSLCIAISATFVIKYKEAPRPGLPSIKGTWAVIIGIINLLIFGLGSIYLFYEATISLLK